MYQGVTVQVLIKVVILWMKMFIHQLTLTVALGPNFQKNEDKCIYR